MPNSKYALGMTSGSGSKRDQFRRRTYRNRNAQSMTAKPPPDVRSYLVPERRPAIGFEGRNPPAPFFEGPLDGQ